VIPIYEAQKPFLMLYSSLFCFLLLGFAFYSRHTIARALAPKNEGRFSHAILMLMPGAFIAATFGFILAYHWTLQLSLTDLRLMGVSATTKVMLEKADYLEIPGRNHAGPMGARIRQGRERPWQQLLRNQSLSGRRGAALPDSGSDRGRAQDANA
jgi:hypothetical protein